MYYNVLFVKSFWCHCMAINASVQNNGGLLPDIILLTRCYYHRETRLNAMKMFCFYSLCSRIAKSCTRYALHLYSRIDILGSCFLCLVQDAPALPFCRAFVATATILPGVYPLKADVPPKSRCHRSCCSYLGDRPPVTAIPAAD